MHIDAAQQEIAGEIGRIEAEGGVEALRIQVATWIQALHGAQQELDLPNGPTQGLLIFHTEVRRTFGERGVAAHLWHEILSGLYDRALTAARYLLRIEAARTRIAEIEGSGTATSGESADLLRAQEAAFGYYGPHGVSLSVLMTGYRHLLDLYAVDGPDTPMGRFFAYQQWLTERFGPDEAAERLGLGEPSWDPIAQRRRYDGTLDELMGEVGPQSPDGVFLDGVLNDSARDSYDLFMPVRCRACFARSEHDAVARVLEATFRRLNARTGS